MTIIHNSNLPNYVREQLLQTGAEAIARVYEALLFLGWQVEQPFTEAELLRLVKPYHIGRRALRAALSSTAAFIHLDEKRITAGRSAQQFQARTLADLCGQLYLAPDVAPSQIAIHPAMESDPISPADLQHGHYRRILHYRLIERRQGEPLSRPWLAARVGVCARTLRRWEKALRIRVEQVVERHVLSRSLLADLPEAIPWHHRPMWIEAFGKSWRATQHTALWLLNQTIDVILCRQRANRYYLA